MTQQPEDLPNEDAEPHDDPDFQDLGINPDEDDCVGDGEPHDLED